FVGGDALGDVHHDLPLGQAGGGRLAHHVGVRDLVAVLVVDAGHGGVGDTGVGQQQRLQFGGGHLEALVLDQLLDPVDDEQPAGLVHMSDVPGVQPAVLVDHGGGGVGPAEVALHHLGAPDEDLAGLAGPE